MRVRWTKPASSDLAEIRGYLAEVADAPAAAERCARQILSAVMLLRRTPRLGHPGRIAETRELIVPKTRFIIAYRVRHGSVEILRVLHSSRR